MQAEPEAYTVVDVRPAESRPDEPPQAPPEILARFEGRTFTLGELEERGVRIAGGRATYTANGEDWLLRLFPEVPSTEPA